jgi:hypothetical protein
VGETNGLASVEMQSLPSRLFGRTSLGGRATDALEESRTIHLFGESCSRHASTSAEHNSHTSSHPSSTLSRAREPTTNARRE